MQRRNYTFFSIIILGPINFGMRRPKKYSTGWLLNYSAARNSKIRRWSKLKSEPKKRSGSEMERDKKKRNVDSRSNFQK